jgi:predicted 3-demethylubiquinone-9 3-methyltransferase (glyoxalase superfamily)
MTSIVPNLWFTGNAQEAVDYYLSIFPNSEITQTFYYGEDYGDDAGKVLTVEFTLNGSRFVAINGPAGVFNQSGIVSFAIMCDSQQEVDYYWNHFEQGGQPQQCGWIGDKFGFVWQVVPTGLVEMMKSPDVAAVARMSKAMMSMVKLDLPALEAAFAGADA